MDKIGALIWVRESGGIEFAKNACEFIENEINATGGIAGKDIFLQLEILPNDSKPNQHQVQIFKKMQQTRNLLFCELPGTGGKQALENLKTLKSQNSLFFTDTDPGWNLKEPIHSNIFDISKSGIRQKQIMPALLDPLDAGSIIFFHMDHVNLNLID